MASAGGQQSIQNMDCSLPHVQVMQASQPTWAAALRKLRAMELQDSGGVSFTEAGGSTSFLPSRILGQSAVKL